MNEPVQPAACAMTGVNAAVQTPPIWHPMFMIPDTNPAEAPPISALMAQNALCAKYSAPAPPASTRAARAALISTTPR